MTTKIYEVTIESNKYEGQMAKRFNVVAGSCTQAAGRMKSEIRSHEEITAINLIAKA